MDLGYKAYIASENRIYSVFNVREGEGMDQLRVNREYTGSDLNRCNYYTPYDLEIWDSKDYTQFVNSIKKKTSNIYKMKSPFFAWRLVLALLYLITNKIRVVREALSIPTEDEYEQIKVSKFKHESK